MASRAQTETLGFVLVFAIITASIGLVYASGFTGLNDAREFEQVNNAERAFEVFADNIDDIVQWNAPSRATEIRLSDATLTVGEPVEIRVNDSGGGLDLTYPVRPIIYDAYTDERIIYVQGTIIRETRGDAVVLRESSMLITENRTVIPFIQTRLSGTGSVGGSTTVLIQSSHGQSTLLYANDNPPSPVWFNVTSPRSGAWIHHLESKPGVTECLRVSNTTACKIETNRIHITRVQIDVEFR